MQDFEGKRVQHAYTASISAPPSQVFSLLCPVKEYDWLDGWSCNMVYSESGTAEDNCVFTSSFPDNDESVWVAVKQDSDVLEKSYVTVNPRSRVMRLDVRLTGDGNNGTEGTWTVTLTGLTPEGNAATAGYTEEVHRHFMGMLIGALKHYCETGKKLETGGHFS